MVTFELNKTYNYSTIAPILIGSDYKAQKVKAIFTAQEAIKYRDITTLHETMKTAVPTLPTSINDCTYILFQTDDNETHILALEYIDTFSIELVETINIRIDIPDANINTMSLLRTRLKELGVDNFNIYTY